MNTPEKPPVRPSGPRNPIHASTETPRVENEPHTGAQRIRLDNLTSDQLDDLYDRLEAAEETYNTWQRRAQRSLARIEYTRSLHTPLQRASLICARCSGWDGRRVLGVLTDYPCATLTALGHPNPAQPNPGPTGAPPSVSTAPQTPAHTPGGSADAGPRPEPSDGRTPAPAQPCDGCGHPEHPARECPAMEYGERCACDEPVPN